MKLCVVGRKSRDCETSMYKHAFQYVCNVSMVHYFSARPKLGEDKVSGKPYVDKVLKAFNDKIINGLRTIENVDLVSLYPINVAQPPSFIDQRFVREGMSLLLTQQMDPRENGVYHVISDGNLSRRKDINHYNGVHVKVTDGSTFAKKSFVCISPAHDDLNGVSALTFVQM